MAQLFLGNPLLDGLNPEQADAVTHTQGPLLVIAAPGSGKTTVLTRRIAFLIHQGVRPDEILAVTFTRKAAQEMGERLTHLLKDKNLVKQLTICTFNSLGLKLLDNRWERLGFRGKPHLLLETTQRTLLDVLRRELDAEEIPHGDAAGFISRAKSCLLKPSEISRVSADETQVKKARLYAAYEKRLKQQNLFDFDDQILLPVRLMEQDAQAGSELQNRFNHILVDEFQDTNRAQYILTRMLAAPQNNLFAVGDDAQGIYGFRAADLDNLLNFEKDFAGSKHLMMETNYRSTPPIVALANNLIKHNSRQIPKTIRSAQKTGEQVEKRQCNDSFEEAIYVAQEIAKLITAGYDPDHLAVLYRTHAQSGLVIEALTAAKIPYTAKKSGHFYENPAIQELLGYLRLISTKGGPQALAGIAMERLLERTGCQTATLAILRAHAELSKTTLWDAAERADTLPLPTLAQRAAAKQAVAIVKKWRGSAKPPATLILEILDDTRMRKVLERQKREDARQKLDVLSTFQEQVRRWNLAGIDEVLKKVDEQLEPKRRKKNEQAVQLMTIHSSKGLEWDAVFVLGLEEGVLPYQMAIEEGGITEERRLFYVAITRARRWLHITYSREQIRFGHRRDAIPSRFLREMAAPPQMTG